MMFRIGVDVGGTFTDLSLVTEDAASAAQGGLETFKTLSTPHDPSIGVLDGMRLIAEAKGLSVAELAAKTHAIVHGTTVTTNAVLTRGGAKTGLLTTRGVRDALEMRRGIRERQYDNHYKNVEPLVPRYLRLPVTGRLDARGDELTSISDADVKAAAAKLEREGVESVAICFMNSFANPAHEQQAAKLLRALLPAAYVSVSSEVLPTIRFYDRVSTTALDAYVGPVLERYLKSLTARLSETGFRGVLLIMQSNGGVALPEITRKRPAGTLLSGPAAGPRAAATYSANHGAGDCTVVDMGGTSFDASLVRDGRAALNAQGEIARLRIALPMLEIVTIGAGGGSIGWLDDGGLLHMGPKSAGAAPGPACYGRGGKQPTCTDADLVLGYLDPASFAGGKLPLDAEKASEAIRVEIAEPLGMDVEKAAAGMYRIINTNMAHGLREVTVKRGLDPREFPMVVAGGAGALHACMIARELGIGQLLVPPTASTLCATGMLLCDLQHDFVRSCVGRLGELELDDVRSLVASMKAEGQAQLDAEGARSSEHAVAFDLRYLKQYHEVTVTMAEDALASGDLEAMAEEFHRAHNQLYGYDLKATRCGLELINVRVRSVGKTAPPRLGRIASAGVDPGAALKGHRRAYVPEQDAFMDVPVYDGALLGSGNVIDGPALIARTDTTIFVSESYIASIDDYGTAALNARREEMSS